MKVSRALVASSALTRMKREARKGLPKESGGILIGHFERRQVVITGAGDPGPAARSTRSGFRRDGDHSQRLLDAAVARSGGEVDYVGEWHSHPENVGASPTDRASIGGISKDPDYRRSHPVLILLRRNGRSWNVDAFQFTDGRLLSLRLVTQPVRARRSVRQSAGRMRR